MPARGCSGALGSACGWTWTGIALATFATLATLAACKPKASLDLPAARPLGKEAVDRSKAEASGRAGESDEDEEAPAPGDSAELPPTDDEGGDGGAADDREGVAATSSPEGPRALFYAALSREACEAELRGRGIAFDRVEEARGVLAPLRLRGPLSGVRFRSNLPDAVSRTSPYDIYDCRLVLALDDFAKILARHGIVEVVHLSVYRPSRKLRPGSLGRRHAGALAIDASIFRTADGRSLSVQKDFQPRRRGARACPAPRGASELHRIACEAGEDRLFNVLLTPHYNRAHYNHFHLEITANVSWTLVR